MDYQQTTANYQQESAKKAATITTDAAKYSANTQTKSTDRYANIMSIVESNTLTASDLVNAQKMKTGIEAGDVWRNDIAFSGTAWGLGVDQTVVNMKDMGDNLVSSAFDYLGTEVTVKDKEYEQAMRTLELGDATIAALTANASALEGSAAKIESAGTNVATAFSQSMASFSALGGGWYSMGGGFGGTSKGGGGAWVGTYPTPSWSGPAISDYVRSNPSGTSWKGSSFSWGAKGSLIDEPSRIIAGEKGRELLLPNYLTELFLRLAAMGFNGGADSSGDIVTIVNIDGAQVEKVVSKRQKRNLNQRGLKLR